MFDLLLSGLWIAVLIAGIALCVALKQGGMAVTHVRDLLHIGAGVWVFGWPSFATGLAPCVIACAGAIGLLIIGGWTAPSKPIAAIRSAVSDHDERWNGLLLYALSFAIGTVAAFIDRPFPAAAALLCLAWGDGIGGWFGRRYGRHFFRLGWSKPKSWEGALAVAVASALAIAAVGWRFGRAVPVATVVVASLVASLAEALAPRASDNLLVPISVWAFLR